MNINHNTFLRGNIQSGFDGDLFTNTEKNISNWTASGTTTASISYNSETKIDTLTFSSGITPATTAQQFVEGFAKYGITWTLSEAQNLISRRSGQSGWTGYPNTPYSIAFMIGKRNGSSYGDNIYINIMLYYTGLGNISFVPLSTSYPNYTIAIYGGNKNNILQSQSLYYYNINTNTIGNLKEDLRGTNTMVDITKSGTLSVYTTIDKDYTLNFTTEFQKKYLLELNQLTSTGYTKDSSIHDITLTNDSDSYTLDFDNTISSDYNRYRIKFTANTSSVSLKLSLKGMKGENVDLKIKDISLFELN